jgi:hypothetical protein
MRDTGLFCASCKQAGIGTDRVVRVVSDINERAVPKTLTDETVVLLFNQTPFLSDNDILTV